VKTVMSLVALVALIGAAPASKPAPESALGFSELPPQQLAPNSCALFLWDRATEKRIVMAVAQPAMIRVVRGDETLDLAQVSVDGAPVLGFAPHARYGDTTLGVGLDLEITPSEGGGAVIRSGTVTVTEADGSAVVAPVAGLVGCATGG
jgi:hypothetical protein